MRKTRVVPARDWHTPQGILRRGPGMAIRELLEYYEWELGGRGTGILPEPAWERHMREALAALRRIEWDYCETAVPGGYEGKQPPWPRD